LVPVTCDSGSTLFGCTIASFPWLIAALVAIVALLVFARLALAARERWLRRSNEPAPAPVRAPPNVAPGSPLQPPAAGAQQPAQVARPPAKPTPLQLRISDPPDLRLSSFQGDLHAEGDFGDMLTSVLLASQGWKQLPSKLQRGRGIGGLFVRELRGGGGYECLASETKTNSAPYDAASMSDDKLAGDIGELYELGALNKTTADELERGLEQGSSFFRKELWRHDLSNGLTTITELGRKGEKGRSVTRSNARLVAALHMSLEHFDRHAVYLGQRPVDESDV
jgi:hypothetical protein